MNNKAKGSGVALYLHNSMNGTILDELSQSTLNLETIFVSITNTSSPITVGVVYRPPSASHVDSLNEFKRIIALPPRNPTYILGDFNVNLFENNSKVTDFEDLILTEGLTPLISTYTHHRPNSSRSCIDNILTNSVENVLHSGTVTNRISHHLPVFQFSAFYMPKTEKEKIPQFYDFSNSNLDKFVGMLSDGRLESDENFDDFAHTYQSCLDTSCKLEKPQYSKRNRNNNTWITDAIIQSIKTKDELYDDWNKTRNKVNPGGDANLYLNYSSYRFELKHIIKAAQKNFYGSKFLECKGDSKKTWRIINELRGKSRKSTKPQFIINNERII